MMNEIPTKTRTGERTEPFLMVGRKKSRVDSGSGNLPSLRRPEDESVTRAGKARWKVLGPQDAWPCIIPGLDLVYSAWLRS